MGKRILALLLCCILAVCLLTPALAQAAQDAAQVTGPVFELVDAYVRREMKTGRIRGLSLAIVRAGGIVYQKGYGYAGPNQTEVTANTPFIIGSVSKTITALAIRQLVNAGKIAYTAPAQRYIPWFAVADADASSRITIADLVEHKSGFSTAAGSPAYLYTGKYTLEQLVRGLSKVHLDRPVGASFEYSNLNYLVLGLVVQYVTGGTYEAYIQNAILGPLGMKGTYLSEEEALQHGMASGYRVVYGIDLPMRPPYPRAFIPAGFVISTAEDMAAFVACYLNQGYSLGKSVIPNNILAPPADPLEGLAGSQKRYSLYWELETGNQGYLGHTGSTFNYFAQILFSQESKLGVVVLTNTVNDFSAPPVNAQTIANGVVGILHTGGMPPPQSLRLSAGGVIQLALAVFVVAGVAVRAYRVRFFGPGLAAGKRRRAWSLASLAAVDLLLPLLFLFGVPIVYDCSLSFALSSIPEQTLPLVFGAAALLVIAAVKLYRLVRYCGGLQKRPAKPCPPVGTQLFP